MISPVRRSFATKSSPRQEEQDGPAQRAFSHPRGTREDHRTARLVNRSICRTQRSDGRGAEERVRELEAEIDDLLREKEKVEKWATVRSA
jgi:hypothetical protein